MKTFIGIWMLGQLMWSAPMPGQMTVAECNARAGELAQRLNAVVQIPILRPNDVQIGCFAQQEQNNVIPQK